MIRRRSTLDHTERVKHNKLVEILAILDLCLQLPSDDRVLLRNQVKQGDEQLERRIYQCKKDKNYQALQIFLRKHVQKSKENQRFNLACRNTKRGRTPQTLKSLRNQTESSYHNSLHNSLKSSPNQKTNWKGPTTTSDMARHIENEITKEIKREIQKQECEQELKDITPREIKVQVKPLLGQRKPYHNISQCQLDMKAMIKAKMTDRERNSNQIKESSRLGKENFHREIKQVVNQFQNKAPLSLTIGQRSTEVHREVQKTEEKEEQKYGEFYKRIKKVIEEAY